MMRPFDIATRHTVDFINSHVRPNSTILEIGCGDGDVAHQLNSLGHDVTAIDTDAGAIDRARGKSVNAVAARWPDYQSDPMNVIVFTRSLHHMGDLNGAIAAARSRLRDGGALLIEDFAFYAANEQTSAWFAAQLRRDPITKLLEAAPDSFAEKLLEASPPHNAWHSNHGHDLHSIEAMTAAVAAQFQIQSVDSTPYLYRYLIAALPGTNEAADLVDDFFSQEKEMIASEGIIPIGRRIIATQKDGGR